MRKTIFFVFIMLLLSGCDKKISDFKYFENGEYIGFDDVDTDLSRQECINSGFLVLDGIMIEDNYEKVEEFITNSEEGNNNRLRIVVFQGEEGPTYMDLVFYDGGYYFYYMDEETFPAQAYPHLLVLRGKWGQPIQEYKMVVVSDKEGLTFDEVNKTMVSSSMPFIESVGRHRVVLFNY